MSAGDGYQLQTELAASRALRAAILRIDPIAGREARVTRCVWSELHGAYFLTVRMFGRDYHRTLTPADGDPSAGGGAAAVAEGVMEEVRASAPEIPTRRH